LIFHEVTDKDKLAPLFMAHGVDWIRTFMRAPLRTSNCLLSYFLGVFPLINSQDDPQIL